MPVEAMNWDPYSRLSILILREPSYPGVGGPHRSFLPHLLKSECAAQVRNVIPIAEGGGGGAFGEVV